jgi:hypothetical protein
MQYRIDTQAVTEEERRAIKWGTNGHRTPASRELCAEFAEKAIRKALDEVLVPYRAYMKVLESAREGTSS